MLKVAVTGEAYNNDKRMNLKFSKILPWTILLISVSSILPWCSLPIGNTAMWWCIQALIIYFLYRLKPIGYEIWQIKCFLMLLGVSALCGVLFMTENYWDWKMLVSNLMVFSMPMAAYVYSNPSVLTKTLRLWFKIAWLLLILLFPFLSSDAFGRYLVPYAFLALWFPLLNRKYWVGVLVAYGITVYLGIANRSDIIKFTVSLILGIFCLINGTTHFKSITKLMFVTLFAAPVSFFILGVTGVFNIFNIEEDLGLEGKYEYKNDDGDDTSALVDTRTFLYVEEIESALNNNYVIQGRTIARGYDSVFFGADIDKAMNVKRGERQSCETSILNIFNYFGLIGVVLYFLIFFGASYKGVFQSNNVYIPIVGLSVAFRWAYGWVEDFSCFDLNMLMLFIMIGMCYSPLYRKMTNTEFKQWMKTIIR